MGKTLGFIFVLSCFLVGGQTQQVKAEKGDGIFSLLRKQGLDPVKYYAEFIQLNQANIKNGSQLSEGLEYIIPDAPDSYKKTALSVSKNPYEERPIFNKELAAINAKSDKLNNGIIYLLPGRNGLQKSNRLKQVRNQILKNVAQELMVHGAKVFLVHELDSVLGNTTAETSSGTEIAFADKRHMQHFVGTINKQFLKNNGKYQRVLVLNFNDTAEKSKYYDISIFHHEKSMEGERFAQTLQDIFSKNSVKNPKENPIDVFENADNLYLVKNVLPPVTMIDVRGADNTKADNAISIRPREKLLTDIITNGVLSDYADLYVEE